MADGVERYSKTTPVFFRFSANDIEISAQD
jgi:hypothetical protein